MRSNLTLSMRFIRPPKTLPPPAEAIEEAFALVTGFSSLCRTHLGLAQAIGVRLAIDQME